MKLPFPFIQDEKEKQNALKKELVSSDKPLDHFSKAINIILWDTLKEDIAVINKKWNTWEVFTVFFATLGFNLLVWYFITKINEEKLILVIFCFISFVLTIIGGVLSLLGRNSYNTEIDHVQRLVLRIDHNSPIIEKTDQPGGDGKNPP